MNITTLHEETSIDALVDRMFPELAAKERKKVAAAIIKANPKFEGLDRLAAGTVVRVPKSPGVKVPPTSSTREIEDPVAAGADVVATALGAYGAHLAQRHDQYQEQAKQSAALLTDAEFKKALRQHPDAAELIPGIDAAIKARAKEAAARHKEFEHAVKKLGATLGSL